MAPLSKVKRDGANIERSKSSARRITTRSKQVVRSKKSSGLPRPKSQISYNIPRDIRLLVDTTSSSHSPTHKDASRSRSSTPTSPPDPPLVQLSRITLLLDLIHRRNKNQHRNQNFWKWLCLLRRSIKNLTCLHHRLESLNVKKPISTRTSQTTTTTSNSKLQSADSVRKTFELRSELRSRIEVCEDWIRETLVPGCFVAFSAVVADTQFANLGVVLVGVLAEVTGRVVGPMRKMEREKEKEVQASGFHSASVLDRAGGKHGETMGKYRGEGGSQDGGYGGEGDGAARRTVFGVSTLVTGPDQGEVIERIFSDGDGDEDRGFDMAVANRNEGVIRNGDKGVRIRRRPESDAGESVSEGIEAGTAPGGLEGFLAVHDEATDTPLSTITSSTTTTSAALPLPLPIASSRTLPSTPGVDTSPDKFISSTDPISKRSPGAATRTTLSSRSDVSNQKVPPSKSRSNTPTVQHDESERRKEKKKKKKEKGNAIDDLFGGLF